MPKKVENTNVDEQSDVSDISDDDDEEDVSLIKRLKQDSPDESPKAEIIPAKKKFQRVPSKNITFPITKTPTGKFDSK